MNLFSAQHSYRLGSDNQVDKRFVTLRQFVKYFKGSEPQYFYFEQKENGETDVSNWRFGVLFYVNGRKVQIKQPNTKDWLNRFTYKVDNGSWGEGNKISTVESIEKQLGGKMKQLKNNAIATNVFMAIKMVCEEYGIECPSDVWNPFYQDLALAVNPNLFGETHANRSREKALAYDEGRSETRYRFASRQIKNSVENDWRQVAHNLYPNVWKYWFSDVAKEANKGNGFNRQTFDYGIQMIVERGGRDSSDENKFFLHFANAYYTAQREGKLDEFLDNLYEDVSNMAKYEGYKVTNSRKINNSKSYDELVRIALDSGDVLDIQENGDIETWYCSNKKEANTQADIINVNCGNKSVCYNFRKGNGCYKFDVHKSMIENSRKIESAKEEDCGTDACVLTPFGEIDRTVANADFTDESFEAYVVEPYAEESDGMFVTELETKGE